jgi:hypothetical protein
MKALSMTQIKQQQCARGEGETVGCKTLLTGIIYPYQGGVYKE